MFFFNELFMVLLLRLCLNLAESKSTIFWKNENFHTKNTLRMVSMVFRHGHRAPVYSYPKDPYRYYKWHGGMGALSRKGAKDMYNFGRTLRKRYDSLFLGNQYYTTDLMQFNSSDTERCLMSASSLIAGLLPPPHDHKHNLRFRWQPVPIHTIPIDKDKFIALKTNCPRYSKEYREVFRNMYFTKEEKNLMNFVSQNTGVSITNQSTIFFIEDTLRLQKLENLKLPKWTENGIFEEIQSFVADALLLLSRTSCMKKIKGGPLITTIFDNMISYRSGKHKRKLFLYSGHDSTLVSVMNALNIINQTTGTPDFGATLIFELHDNPMLKYDLEVKIFYYFSNLEKVPINISIPNCPAPCSLKQFGATIEHLIVRNYDELCRI